MIIKSSEIKKNIFKYKCIILHGENLSLKKEIEDELLIDYKKNGYSTKIYREEELKKNPDIINFIFSENLFDEKEVFVIKDISDKITKFINEDNLKSFSKHLILTSKYLKKGSKIRGFFENSKLCATAACYEDDDNQIQNLLKTRLYENGIKINYDTIQKLVMDKNLNRNDINEAIKKLSIIKAETNVIGDDILFDIFNATNTYDNFEIANIVISGNSKKLNKALNDIYNASGYYNELIPAIRFKVKKLIEILEYNEDESDISKKINNFKPPIFWKEKNEIIIQLKKWKKSELIKLLKEIYNVELKCKEHYNISNIIFNKFLLDTCSKNV